MAKMSFGRLHKLVFVVVFFAVSTAGAMFVLVEDFTGMDPCTVSGQNGWYSSPATSGLIVDDPDEAGNRVLSVTTNSAILRGPATVLQGATRMMFLRFRIASQQNFSFGLSHLSSPVEFSDFGPELGMSNSTNELRINNDGHYDVLTVIDPNVWYNCWVLVNNNDDTSEVWLNNEPFADAASEDKLFNTDSEDVFGFRTGGLRNLVTFFIKTGGGSSGNYGPVYFDDIYIESTNTLNLNNPLCPDKDMSGNCIFNFDDFAIFADYWLVTDCNKCGGADLTGDSSVNIEDLAEFARKWLSH